MATIQRFARMNRLYITGDTAPAQELLSAFRARRDQRGWWLPIYRESEFREALKAEKAYQAKLSAERDVWAAAKAIIPPDYLSRHGSAYGGDVVIDGEVISEPACSSDSLPWREVARHEVRCRDLSGGSSVNGRVMDREILYAAETADGRVAYRIAHSHGFGDDIRDTYYLPPDMWRGLMTLEVLQRRITVEAAAAWLAQYRGCVGTELYEFAARNPWIQPAQVKPRLAPPDTDTSR